MAPENAQVIHLKLQMQPDVDFFEKLLTDNKAQEICKNLRITSRRVHQLLHESPNLVYRNMKTAPALTAKPKKVRVDWVKKKSNMDPGEMGSHGVFW